MIIQNRDGSLVHEHGRAVRTAGAERRYAAQIPADLLDEQGSVIERIISFAFDTLGARRLEVRVRETE